MENCIAYWQDQTYAEVQRGEQLVVQARTQQAVSNFFNNLGQALGEYGDRQARQAEELSRLPQPPAYTGQTNCQAQPNGGGWSMSCQ
jgi:hypothetical protein